MASYNFATESQREHHEKTPLMISSASVQDAPHLWKRRRKLFLLLTEPESSFWATIVFVVLIASITLSNVIMVTQTMESWQFTPTDCRTCGGYVSASYYCQFIINWSMYYDIHDILSKYCTHTLLQFAIHHIRFTWLCYFRFLSVHLHLSYSDITYLFEDDDQIHIVDGPCTCPPTPLPITESLLRYLMYLFTVEWTLRAICFTADPAKATSDVRQFYDYLTSAPMMLDFLAIFPYYLAFVDIHALVSLRLLRLFRIFSLVRLGQYNSMMMTLTNVLTKSIQYLKLLILILTFGGALFGSIVYWMERGTWKYYEPSNSYQFVRLRVDGVTEEISRKSWFLV